MQWPFSGVRKTFFRGRNLQVNPGNSTERAILAKFQALIFENSEPEKKTIPYPQPFHTPTRSEDVMGGWKKEGGGKPDEGHPSQKGVSEPPSFGTFSTPLRCRCFVFFPVKESTTGQTRSFFGWVQNFSGGRVLWYVLLPPYVLHTPPIMAQLDSLLLIGNGPNTVSESTVSNTELSEFFGPHRVPGWEQ